jgi:uncharacterized protein with gpF-like domain
MGSTLTGLTLVEEQLYQERETEKLANRMAKPVASDIALAMLEFATNEGNPGDQAKAIDDHKKRLSEILDKYYKESFRLFGKRVLDAGAKAHPGKWETKDAENEFDQAQQDWISRMVAQQVTPIAGTTGEQAQRIIRAAVSEAVAEGLGQAATGDLIRSRIKKEGAALARGRSRVIARTETHSSANAAGQEAAQATGLDMQKEWVSARGPRTREDHSEADGQTVDLAASFFVGGEELRYPGDPNGSAGNIINCRCASVHVVLD